jgi:O-antigen/teichoic acid export membrane protein
MCSTALTALGVAGSYAMLAMGRVRLVTFLNVAGAAAMIIAIFCLLPAYGIRGMALARLMYGPIPLGVYVPLFVSVLRGSTTHSSPQSSPDARAALVEEAQ